MCKLSHRQSFLQQLLLDFLFGTQEWCSSHWSSTVFCIQNICKQKLSTRSLTSELGLHYLYITPNLVSSIKRAMTYVYIFIICPPFYKENKCNKIVFEPLVDEAVLKSRMSEGSLFHPHRPAPSLPRPPPTPNCKLLYGINRIYYPLLLTHFLRDAFCNISLPFHYVSFRSPKC